MPENNYPHDFLIKGKPDRISSYPYADQQKGNPTLNNTTGNTKVARLFLLISWSALSLSYVSFKITQLMHFS